MTRDIFSQIRLLRAPPKLTLNVSRDETYITSLSNLCKCFINFILKNFLLISYLNQPSLSYKPLHLAVLWHALLKGLHSSLKIPFRNWKAAIRSPWGLLPAEWPQFFPTVFTGEVLQPPDHLCGPPQSSLQQFHIRLTLGAPELNALLRWGLIRAELSHKITSLNVLVMLLLTQTRNKVWARQMNLSSRKETKPEKNKATPSPLETTTPLVAWVPLNYPS